MSHEFNRRQFISRAGGVAGAAWISTHWPAALEAASHAHRAAQSGKAYKFQFFTPDEAKEVEAMSARIIPTDDLPGAREAGVIFFIDRVLSTFASDDQPKYREGLPILQARTRELFSGVEKFSAANAEQQDQILKSMDEDNKDQGARRGRNGRSAQTFFEAVRIQSIAGFLIDPESGNNTGVAGWKVIGREEQQSFQPPFGFYDKDYPGWKPLEKTAEKS